MIILISLMWGAIMLFPTAFAGIFTVLYIAKYPFSFFNFRILSSPLRITSLTPVFTPFLTQETGNFVLGLIALNSPLIFSSSALRIPALKKSFFYFMGALISESSPIAPLNLLKRLMEAATSTAAVISSSVHPA